MILSTLCYLQQEGQYLMLHRVKKKNDMNQDKWIGIGGKLEAGESPEECLLREAKEETGLILTDYAFRGVVTFVSDQWGTEYMFLYTASGFSGTMKDCDEGNLEWVPFDKIPTLPLWQGDHIFLRLLREDAPFFSLKLEYQGDTLVRAALDGKDLPCESW